MGRANDKTTTSEKKPYEAPSLIEWGNLRDLTLTAGVAGVADGNTSKKSTSKQTH